MNTNLNVWKCAILLFKYRTHAESWPKGKSAVLRSIKKSSRFVQVLVKCGQKRRPILLWFLVRAHLHVTSLYSSPDGQTRRGLDGAQAHPRHQHARPWRARAGVHREYTLARPFPPLRQCRRQVTDQCLPLQVNRIKIPKQLDELVEMQNESANPVLKVLFKIKAELRGVCLGCFLFPSPLHVPVLSPSRLTLRENSLLSWTDLVDIHEMLQLPGERQHFKAGCRLVYSLLWVRNSLLAHFFFNIAAPAPLLPFLILLSPTFVMLNGTSLSHHHSPSLIPVSSQAVSGEADALPLPS